MDPARGVDFGMVPHDSESSASTTPPVPTLCLPLENCNFKAPNLEMILTPLWMLLSRKVKSENKSEVWFVLNDIPIRYTMMENAFLTEASISLPAYNFCTRHVAKKITVGDIKKALAQFVIPLPKEGVPPSDSDSNSLTGVRHGARRNIEDDKLKLALLYLLCSVFLLGVMIMQSVRIMLSDVIEDKMSRASILY